MRGKACGTCGSGVDAEPTETGAAAAAQVLAGDSGEIVERVADGVAEQPRRGVRVGVRTARRLGHDRIDHAELEAVRRVGLERRSRLLRLGCVTPQDRGAAL